MQVVSPRPVVARQAREFSVIQADGPVHLRRRVPTGEVFRCVAVTGNASHTLRTSIRSHLPGSQLPKTIGEANVDRISRNRCGDRLGFRVRGSACARNRRHREEKKRGAHRQSFCRKGRGRHRRICVTLFLLALISRARPYAADRVPEAARRRACLAAAALIPPADRTTRPTATWSAPHPVAESPQSARRSRCRGRGDHPLAWHS